MRVKTRLGAAAVALVVAVLVPCGMARADSVAVLLAGPTEGSPVPTEVVNRVRGELVADGFRVDLASSVPESERIGALRRSGRATQAAIVVGLFVDENTGGIDLSLLDTLSDRAITRHLEGPTRSPDQGPQVVARHAVSLLRASLLDFVVEGLRSAWAASAPTGPSSAPNSLDRASQPMPSTPQKVAPGPDRSSEDVAARSASRRFAIEGGLGVLGSFEGVGPAILPVVRLRMEANPTFQLRLTGAGFGSNPSVQAPTGSATVEQDLVQFDAAAVLGEGRSVRPLAALGIGAYHAGVTGSGASPYEGRTDSAVALALAGTVGSEVEVAKDIEVSFELQAVVTEPGVVLRFVDVSAARMGRPLFLATVTVAGWI